MIVVNSVSGLRGKLDTLKPSLLGFVPTMGALHEGHISLAARAKKDCPVMVVSIYVNPTQFNDKEDLKNYPRTIQSDIRLLKKHLRKNDIVFIPDDREIYPEPGTRKFSFGSLDRVMEALHRPGHFNGVAQVVSRLFEIVKPDIAYFGLKDFQQVAVIKSLVRQLSMKVRIEACPIIRESDGLAMSSRNRLLEPDIRRRAPVIRRTLIKAAEMINTKDIGGIRDYVKKTIELEKDFEVEYFEIADDEKLIPVSDRSEMKRDKRYYGCIAVRAGRIRLIDNIEITLA
ncbi:MAG: pantoate--beta-alanine ligase [Bacteroidales bacterium]|jgi:pantoate--beta-alanine ligase|nr:pantoate--beta-alanine ligase [Bacteroidales bacterium]